MEVKSEFLRCFSNLVYSYVNVWGLVVVKELLDLQFASSLHLERRNRRTEEEGVTGLGSGGRTKKERRWFCVPVFLFLWMGQASGSWIRVSGGKKSGKVLLSVSWGFFFPFWMERRRRG